MRKILFIIIAALCLSSCSGIDNIEFLNLKRDNPLDGKNNSELTNRIDLKFDNYTVYKDNNNDGIINKGETVELRVCLKNTGSRTANGVKATFSTTSGYVSGFTPTSQVNYADIPANSKKWADFAGVSNASDFYLSYYTIKFTVSNTTPVNTVIPINICITDENSNTWTSSFDVKVESTNAQVS
ncbi:membrane lipoprotein lipid attachment site-containing protein, partial [Alistipes sp. ZOR0009]|uniref:membrane lipoprotein lipid attachment site-containing protein n=1 Tax=Alistipes sp. ZOR0009 TaxID=1339253 RepID=UPI000647825D